MSTSSQPKHDEAEGTKPIAKIEPVKVPASEAQPSNDADLAIEADDQSLLYATRALLRLHGIRKSRTAIRDAVEMPHSIFGPREAVSALNVLGFNSSFGALRITEINPNLLPLLAVTKSGEAILLKSVSEEHFVVQTGHETVSEITLTRAQFQDVYTGYVILANELSDEQKEARSGHWFFSAFRKSKWLYVQVMIAAMVSNFLSLTTSIFTMTVYDRIIPNGAFESLIALSIGVGIALGFDFVIKSLRARFIDVASRRADLEISRRLFDRILNLTPTEQKQKTGALAGTVRDFETLRDFFNSSTLVVLIDLPFIAFFIYVIYLIAGPLAYVAMVAVPLVIIVGLGIQPFLARITRGTVQSGMNKQAVLVETLSGLETVNATGSGKLMKKRYEDALDSQSESGNRVRVLTNFIVNFAASVQQYAQVAVIFLGVYLIVDGTITQGALIAAVILGGRTMSPLGQLANTMARVNGALVAYRNLSKLVGGKVRQPNDGSSISRTEFKGEIEFKNVSFTFDGANQPTLRNVSLKIPAGQKVAIVGKMGSGKSTLSRLIGGIFEPTEGAILIDGVDVRQIDKSDLRKNVGIMPQESWLFSGSVRENIQVGFNEYSDEHFLEICKVSGVDDFVGSNPQGYDLMVQEKGAGLSGGQKQAINLARSLLHKPAILLLDEPTSSMDQASEKRVVKALSENLEGKTLITVTHRNPILALVDRVLVMENGQIIADKSPEKLGIKKA